MIGESVAPRHAKGAPERIDDLLSLLDGAAAGRGASLSRCLPETARPLTPAALCDLAEHVAELARGPRRRATVRLRTSQETLELGLQRSGPCVLASLYSTGASVAVRAFERRLDGAHLARLLAGALEAPWPGVHQRETDRMLAAARALSEAAFDADGDAEECEAVAIEPSEELSFAIGAEVTLRPGSAPAAPAVPSAAVLRADLLSLLVRGKLRVHFGDRVREIGDVHVFLVADKLALLARAALEASLSLRPIWRKVAGGGVSCAVRMVGSSGATPHGALAFTIGPERAGAGNRRSEGWTFPALDLLAFCRAVVDFGRALCRTIVRRDRAQSHNLRLLELRSSLREVAELCREFDRDDTLVNQSPESYRAYASPPAAATSPQPDLAHARLRFVPKWSAAVPAIDLRSIFLCDNGFLVGSARELSYIDRAEGTIAWTRQVTRGRSVLTPSGLVRIDDAGQLQVLEVATGDTRTALRLEPRVGGPVTGAVIGAPGLPRMLVITEGRRQIAGVDLEAGEIVWRFVAKRGGTFRLKRAGRLVVITGADRGLFALDAVSGEVVWRYHDRLRFVATPAVCDDSLFAIAGDGTLMPSGTARLCHFDPWSGRSRFKVDLPGHVRPFGSPLVGQRSVIVLGLGPRGTTILGLDRASGAVLYEREACRGRAAAIVVDDTLILNADSGDLVAFGASDGELLYRHVFAEAADGDRPRRLDPVVRSGALFVPQTQVQVVRPADGRLVGVVPNELVADLLRVDEKCDVYVAEESGHVAAYSVAARLALVK
jgi:hypothetical protein